MTVGSPARWALVALVALLAIACAEAPAGSQAPPGGGGGPPPAKVGVAAAQSGDVVLVQPGTYLEHDLDFAGRDVAQAATLARASGAG